MGASLSHKTRSRGRRTGGTYRPIAEINVTPFVDVMLVLLIIFMVSAPLLTTGVPVDLPSSRAKAVNSEDNKPIELSIDGDGQLYIQDEQVEKEKLVAFLTAVMEGDQEQRIYLRADQVVDYGTVMSVLGDLNAAGFNKVALISKPK